MEILDDNAQQVPEGFYLEMCNQLKNLHVALPTPDELERRGVGDEEGEKQVGETSRGVEQFEGGT